MFAPKILITLGLWLIILSDFQDHVAARSLRKKRVPFPQIGYSAQPGHRFYYFKPSLAHDSQPDNESNNVGTDGQDDPGNLDGGVVKGVLLSPKGQKRCPQWCP